MEIHKGTARIAFVGDKYTLKTPNFQTLKQLSDIAGYIRNRDFEGLKKWFGYSESGGVGFKAALSGFLQNWREFSRYKELTDVAVPTHFSIFGLINLQDSAEDFSPDENLFIVLGKAIGLDIMRDSHTFENPDNFGIHQGKIKIRDYGGAKAGAILQAHRIKIREALDNLHYVLK